jgi:hypothetical protein
MFHPTAPSLIGAGGGGDNGLLALWKLDDLPRLAEEAAANNDEADKDKANSAGKRKTSEDRSPLPLRRIKFEGHAHDFCLTPDAALLYVAGFGRLEIWRLA